MHAEVGALAGDEAVELDEAARIEEQLDASQRPLAADGLELVVGGLGLGLELAEGGVAGLFQTLGRLRSTAEGGHARAKFEGGDGLALVLRARVLRHRPGL